MQYSPKLKTAMEDIKKILKQYDLAAIVVIHTPGHAEYLLKVDPTYSCAELKPDGSGVTFKTSSKHYNGNKKERDKHAADTCNMMASLSDVTGRLALSIMEASDMLDKHLDAEHTKGGNTSHNQQNN